MIEMLRGTRIKLSKEKAEKLLHDAVVEGDKLQSDLKLSLTDIEDCEDACQAWFENCEVCLEEIFVGKKIPKLFSDEYDLRVTWDEDLPELLRMIKAIHRRIRLCEFTGKEVKETRSKAMQKEKEGKVFVVHGHDEEMKQSVARFLEKLGLNVKVLHELPDRGRTIIEKFEDHSIEAAYAVVLLSPDDLCSDEKGKDEHRARQNVVFELGFFYALIGRGRVCALMKGNVKRPLDIDGVLYLPFDKAGGWQLELAREMKAADLKIDLNKVAN
jgi:predicted nucleotide-binding protein